MIKQIFNQSSSQRIHMITEGNILKTFLFLSLPGIMMVFIQAAMPVIDGLFIYNYDNAVSGAAISYCVSMQNIIIMGGQGLSSAGSAIIGQINGEGDQKRARGAAGQLMSISAILGIVLVPLLIVLGFIMTASMEAGELKSKIVSYNIILSFSLPLIILQSSFNSIKNVFGHPEITFLRTLIFVPIRLFCTYLYVAVLHLGINGAALSSLTAYICIMGFIVYDMFVKKSEERLEKSDLKIEKPFLKRLARVSWASVVQNSTKSIGFFIIKLETAAYGSLALSAQGVANDISGMFQNFVACYDAAIISFVSINTGAGNGERAKKAAYLAVKIGVISSAALSLICMICGPFIVGLYTSDELIYELAVRANFILSLGFMGFAVMFNEMPAFIGLGLNKASLFIQTMRIWVFRLIALYSLYFFFRDIGVYAIFISFTLANLLGGIVSHLVFRRVHWQRGNIAE